MARWRARRRGGEELGEGEGEGRGAGAAARGGASGTEGDSRKVDMVRCGSLLPRSAAGPGDCERRC